ncbi:AarF/UbiB family protein, partial [Mycobacterium kansasii]
MVKADLKNLRLLVKVLGKHIPTANAKELVDEVADQVAGELDFDAELRNLTYFADRFRGHPAIRIPRPIEELCTQRVLV